LTLVVVPVLYSYLVRGQVAKVAPGSEAAGHSSTPAYAGPASAAAE